MSMKPGRHRQAFGIDDLGRPAGSERPSAAIRPPLNRDVARSPGPPAAVDQRAAADQDVPSHRRSSHLKCMEGLRGEVAPARHPLDADRNDRKLVELHLAILPVAGAQERLRAVMLGALRQDFGRAAQHDPAEPGPVVVIAIGDKRAAGFSRMFRSRFSLSGLPFGF